VTRSRPASSASLRSEHGHGSFGRPVPGDVQPRQRPCSSGTCSKINRPITSASPQGSPRAVSSGQDVGRRNRQDACWVHSSSGPRTGCRFASLRRVRAAFGCQRVKSPRDRHSHDARLPSRGSQTLATSAQLSGTGAELVSRSFSALAIAFSRQTGPYSPRTQPPHLASGWNGWSAEPSGRPRGQGRSVDASMAVKSRIRVRSRFPRQISHDDRALIDSR
jgi:hypothetical protein